MGHPTAATASTTSQSDEDGIRHPPLAPPKRWRERLLWAVRLSIVTTDQERAAAIVGDQETSVRSKPGPVLPGSEPRPAPVTKQRTRPGDLNCLNCGRLFVGRGGLDEPDAG